VVDTFQAAQ